MKMEISGTPQGSGKTSIKTTPMLLVSELQQIVGLVLVPLLVIVPSAISFSNTLYLVNRSTGGQNIRIGFAPSFAPAAGIMLLPTDSLTLWYIGQNISAIADGAGGLLDCMIWSQG